MSHKRAVLAVTLSVAMIFFIPSVIQSSHALSLVGPTNIGIGGSENSLSANPNNASNLVMFNTLTLSPSRLAMYSKDGGTTWHAGTTTSLPPGQFYFIDPDGTVDSSGNFYVGTFGGRNTTTNNVANYLYKSTDGGATWNSLPTPVFSADTSVSLPGGGTAKVCKVVPGVPLLYDYDKIIADTSPTSPYKNNLYYVAARMDLNTTSTACQNLTTFLVTVFRSTDGGATWIDGQAFSLDQFNGYQGEKMVGVTADGTILINSVGNGGGLCTGGSNGLIVSRSVDGGHTYSSACVYNNPANPSGTNPILISGEMAAAYGTNAVITAVGCVSSCGTSPVYHVFALSTTNDGATWTSSPVRIDDVLVPDNSQISLAGRSPWPAVAMSGANGRVDVTWYDHRNGNSTFGDIYASYSNNAGASFATNIRITPQTGCSVSSCCNAPNDFLGIASSSDSSNIAYCFNTNSFFARINFPDFTMAANPGSLNLQQDATGSSTINLSSVNNFTGTVALTATAPSSVTTSFSSASLTLARGGTNSSVLTITAGTNGNVPIGNYTVTITGTSGSISHSFVITVQVSNFFETITPLSLDIPINGTGSVTIIEHSVNGYSGSVTPFISGGLPSCVSSSFNPTAIQLPAHGTASSALTLSPTSSCTASHNVVSVQSNSGLWGSATSFNFNVTDFTLSASPTTLSIKAGRSGASTLSLASLDGFSGTVTLTTSISPVVRNGPTNSLSPASITLSNNSGTSTLTVSTTSRTPKQQYTVTVTATSGSISHAITITVTVTS